MSKEYFKKDESLNILLEKVNKKEDIFWENYWDDNNKANDILDYATELISLQHGVIKNLLVKIKILEDNIKK